MVADFGFWHTWLLMTLLGVAESPLMPTTMQLLSSYVPVPWLHGNDGFQGAITKLLDTIIQTWTCYFTWNTVWQLMYDDLRAVHASLWQICACSRMRMWRMHRIKAKCVPIIGVSHALMRHQNEDVHWLPELYPCGLAKLWPLSWRPWFVLRQMGCKGC